MSSSAFLLDPIGTVCSDLTTLAAALRQEANGRGEGWLDLTETAAPGLAGLAVGDRLFLLTWLHLAQRDVLQVYPRDDHERPLTGVFATRSPDRPNPIGLHRVTVLEPGEQGLRVAPLEAVDGTPIVEIEPVLAGPDSSEC